MIPIGASIIVGFLLFVLPFLIFPIGISPFESPKIYTAEFGIIILSIIGIIKFHKNIFKYRINFFIYFILIFLTVYDLLFHLTSISFFGNQFRQQGILLLWILMLFSFFSTYLPLINIPSAIIAVFTTIEFIMSILIIRPIDERAVGTLGEPNSLAGFVAFLWPFIAFQKQKSIFSKVLFTISTVLILFTIIMSGSRSGLIAFSLEGILFIFFKFSRINISKITIIGFIFLVISFSLPFFQRDVVYENRSEIWQAAIISGYQHPLLGWGFGNTEIALSKYNKKLFNRLQGYYVDSAHNIFLDYWIQGGFIGLSTLILLIYSSLKSFIVKKAIQNISVMLGLLVTLSFNPPSIVGLLGLWYMLGQGVFGEIPLEVTKKDKDIMM